MASMTRKPRSLWRIFLLCVAVLSALWLAGVLYLDITNAMFPRVLIGGLKILAAGYLVLFLLALPVLAVQRLRKQAG